MRIENLRLERSDNKTRSVAKVIWEDCDRPSQDIFFETAGEFAEGLSCDPDAFLVATIFPASRHGERRVCIEGELCPYLRLGLSTAMVMMRYWYGDRGPISIEAKTRSKRRSPIKERAGVFMTGGIDSLASLRTNRLNYPIEHPASVRDGILVFGLEVADEVAFQHVVDLLLPLAEEADFTLLPIYTNARYLDENWGFWIDEFEGAVLSSVAHALSRRLTTVYIASSFDYPYLHPHGSHPLLDPNFSSYGLRIHHDGVALSRFEKTKLLADWREALQRMRVCNKPEHYRAGILNCGRCEKCLRTLTALLILDKLDHATSFAQRDVSPELIDANARLTKTDFPFWEEMIEPLERKGHRDLVEAIRRAIRRYRGEVGWKRPLKVFDRKYLRGALSHLKRSFRKEVRAKSTLNSNQGHSRILSIGGGTISKDSITETAVSLAQSGAEVLNCGCLG